MKHNKRKNTEVFINECIEVRGYKYDYSLVSYKNNKQKVKIICKDHGIFEQTPNNHLSKLQDCPKCSDMYFDIKSNDEILSDFKKRHVDKYDYSKVNYKGNKEKVEIICREHGSFFQTPNNHLRGQECSSCKKIDTEKFINRSNIKHKEKYNYDKTRYINMSTKVKIICDKHGEFEQIPHSHLYGIGCPNCKISKGENEVKLYLDEMNMKYITQHSFDNCKLKKKLRFDFYLPELNTCIEFDGRQHFESIKYYGGDKGLEIRTKRDEIKSEFCKISKINLVRIKFDDDIKNKIYECLS
jgi:Zn finger protein HypA/HybF involved in hydrogenase expression